MLWWWWCLSGSRRRGGRGVEVRQLGSSSPSPRVGRRFAPQSWVCKKVHVTQSPYPEKSKVREEDGWCARVWVQRTGAVRATSVSSLSPNARGAAVGQKVLPGLRAVTWFGDFFLPDFAPFPEITCDFLLLKECGASGGLWCRSRLHGAHRCFSMLPSSRPRVTASHQKAKG